MKRKPLAKLAMFQGLYCVCFSQNLPPSGGYVRGPDKQRVFVFVHGVHGSPTQTWTADNRTYWPNLLKTDSAFDDSDIYVGGYNTPLKGTGATVPDIAESLFQFMDTDDVFKKHREVIFVCHSLGGLVVEQMIIQHRGIAAKIPFIVFYSTPHAGSVVANFASVFIDDPLLKAMVSGGGNNFLVGLERVWAGSGFKIRRYCAFEEIKMTPETLFGRIAPKAVLEFLGGVLVVDPISATYGCDNNAIPIGIPEDHLGVVKPDGLRHLSHVALRNLQKNNSLEPIPIALEHASFDEPLCVFYGESTSGSSAWHKTETCAIKNADRLDTNYRQIDFVFSGGDAKSNMGIDNIPPGLEIRADGGHYWAILNGRRDGDNYYIDTYCGPAPSPGPGCNVKVKIVGHYGLTTGRILKK